MFNNIGKKIKILVKVLFWILMIGVIIGAIIMTVFPVLNSATSEDVVKYMIYCFLIILAGFFILWLLMANFYAMADLVDNTQKVQEELAEIKQILKEKK